VFATTPINTGRRTRIRIGFMTVTMLREWTFSEYFIPLLFRMSRRHEVPATEGSTSSDPSGGADHV
jgi:hypothetical protein